MRLHILVLAGVIAVPSIANAADPEFPRLSDLGRVPVGSEKYVYIGGETALEDAAPTREPDGRLSLRIVVERTSQIPVREFEYADAIVTEADWGREVVDCYKRTIQTQGQLSVTSKGYTDNQVWSSGVTVAKSNTLGAEIVRYVCDSDYRKAVLEKNGSFGREEIVAEILRREVESPKD